MGKAPSAVDEVDSRDSVDKSQLMDWQIPNDIGMAEYLPSRLTVWQTARRRAVCT